MILFLKKKHVPLVFLSHSSHFHLTFPPLTSFFSVSQHDIRSSLHLPIIFIPPKNLLILFSYLLTSLSFVPLKVRFVLISKMRTPVENRPKYELVDCFLRVFSIFLSAVSIWLSVTNQQDNPTYGKLAFNNLIGIKYMVCISAISAGYAICSLLSSFVKFLVTRVWIYFVTDQVVAYLMVTSVAAVVEILYLAYNGDQKVTWSEACTSYGRFCSRLKLALALHAVALCCFFVIAGFSAFRFFTKFEPPLPPNKEVEEQRT